MRPNIENSDNTPKRVLAEVNLPATPPEMKPPPLRLAFSMKETAKILGISYPSVQRLNARGLLRSSSAIRHKLFPKQEIERFLRETLN